MRVILFPYQSEQPIEELDIPDVPVERIQSLYRLLGGDLLTLDVPQQLLKGNAAVALINSDAKAIYRGSLNYRATLFMSPGLGILADDYIAGPMLVAGFANHNLVDAPKSVLERIGNII